MRNVIVHIRQIMTKNTDKKILGRWMIEQCEKRKEQKVYLVNKDYGSPEGFYNMKKEKEDETDIHTEIRLRYMV